jgi:GH24 family phage-related lysozyme (muramidase)
MAEKFAGEQLIKEHEGFEPKAYWDVDHWTIGYGTPASEDDLRKYGHRNDKVSKKKAAEQAELFGETQAGTGLSEKDAQVRLEADVQQRTQKLKTKLAGAKVPWDKMPKDMQAGILSAYYNLGNKLFTFPQSHPKRPGQPTKAGQALQSGDFDTFIDEAFSEDKGFVNAGGEKLSGLVKRRRAEGSRIQKGLELYNRNLAPGTDTGVLNRPGTPGIHGGDTPIRQRLSADETPPLPDEMPAEVDLRAPEFRQPPEPVMQYQGAAMPEKSMEEYEKELKRKKRRTPSENPQLEQLLADAPSFRGPKTPEPARATTTTPPASGEMDLGEFARKLKYTPQGTVPDLPAPGDKSQLSAGLQSLFTDPETKVTKDDTPETLKAKVDKTTDTIQKSDAPSEIKAKTKTLQDLFTEGKKNLEQRELAERVGQALTQLGAGLYGRSTGTDMSGLKFQPSNWDKKMDSLIAEFRERNRQAEVKLRREEATKKASEKSRIKGQKEQLTAETAAGKERQKLVAELSKVENIKRDLEPGSQLRANILNRFPGLTEADLDAMITKADEEHGFFSWGEKEKERAALSTTLLDMLAKRQRLHELKRRKAST